MRKQSMLSYIVTGLLLILILIAAALSGVFAVSVADNYYSGAVLFGIGVAVFVAMLICLALVYEALSRATKRWLPGLADEDAGGMDLIFAPLTYLWWW